MSRQTVLFVPFLVFNSYCSDFNLSPREGEWHLRNDHPQASVLNERKPQAQCEVSTATLRVLMPGGHRSATTESGNETERKRVISGC